MIYREYPDTLSATGKIRLWRKEWQFIRAIAYSNRTDRTKKPLITRIGSQLKKGKAYRVIRLSGHCYYYSEETIHFVTTALTHFILILKFRIRVLIDM